MPDKRVFSELLGNHVMVLDQLGETPFLLKEFSGNTSVPKHSFF
jgi:hypothetical protein